VWIPRSLRIDLIPKGDPDPGQELASAELGESSSPHPLRNQGPLVLSDGTPDLQEELVVRILGHRSLHELDAAAALLELFEQEDLMDVFAGQTIRCRHHQEIKLAEASRIPYSIESRSIETSTAVAVIDVDVALL
jgi:hypothetical protein